MGNREHILAVGKLEEKVISALQLLLEESVETAKGLVRWIVGIPRKHAPTMEKEKKEVTLTLQVLFEKKIETGGWCQGLHGPIPAKGMVRWIELLLEMALVTEVEWDQENPTHQILANYFDPPSLISRIPPPLALTLV